MSRVIITTHNYLLELNKMPDFIISRKKRQGTKISASFFVPKGGTKKSNSRVATQKLHFKPINSLEATGAKKIQPKNVSHEQQRRLVVTICN